jgi:UDP:flavonoid glycosyltransferase YjiC (YdhE family)
MQPTPTILVAPLNWGLGHATRCIPIINSLLAKGCKVIIASSERPYHLLKQEFPQLEHIYFPNYEIEYPENENMAVTLLRKGPEMYWETLKENRRLQQLIWEHNIRGVIADNRFGFYNSRIPTVFLAHQLNLHMTEGFAWLKPIANGLNLKYARKFSQIWVPDFEGAPNLTGELSHFEGLPRTARYVGPLSRFAGVEVENTGAFSGYDVLITMSGPEPQRTLLENRLTEQAVNLPYKTLMVVGKTEDGTDRVEVAPNVHKVAHLPAKAMQEAMLAVKYIVCRSGYSTIMDLAALGLKAAFIPTPGQPEQEYLAETYQQKGFAPYTTQANVDLKALLAKYNNYKGFAYFKSDSGLLDSAVNEFLGLVK